MNLSVSDDLRGCVDDRCACARVCDGRGSMRVIACETMSKRNYPSVSRV